MGGWVYILASKKNGTLYIGVTSNLGERTYQHRENLIRGFTKKYDVHLLVHYQAFDRIEDAIAEEKRLKSWRRSWKIALIEKNNPDWRDLYEETAGLSPPSP